MNSVYPINKRSVIAPSSSTMACRPFVDEESTCFESMHSSNSNLTSASSCPDNDFEQYIFSIFEPPNISMNEKLQNHNHLILTKDHFESEEDSGFLTCNSIKESPGSSPISSPQISTSHELDQVPMFNTHNLNHLNFNHGNGNSSPWNLNGNILSQQQQQQQRQQNNQSGKIKLFSNYSSKSQLPMIELKVLKQPECHHRARYMTEGSRGAIKDETGRGFPVVQLIGYNKSPIKLECFIGHDQKIGEPHLFYQACEVTGKTPYHFARIDGVNIIEIQLEPRDNMLAVIDCMGILKERNVDVERKVSRSRKRQRRLSVSNNSIHDNQVLKVCSTKIRSTHCRMVFRCYIPETNEILQTVSEPILCTQPLGTPEIYKMSLKESDIKGGQELFILGKNFHKDAKVIFERGVWKRCVEPQKEFLNSTHLVCQIPRYEGPEANCLGVIYVNISVQCSSKSSDPVKFTYTKCTSSLCNNTSKSFLIDSSF